MREVIDFNRAPLTGKEAEYINRAMANGKICGDGPFTKECSRWICQRYHVAHTLLTTSCTHALEMAAYLADIRPGDEVIMPSYTFCSTADAFVLRGAKIVFVDIRPDTMNIDEKRIEDAVTEKTKAIVPVHYAGVACAMDEILALAEKYHLKVIEDAAQGMNAYYKGRALGTIGDLGCYSFHETKNFAMGEGGALLFQSGEYLERAEILREKGTDRSKYFRGQVDKYTWQDFGSSYLPSDLNAAYLYAQLEIADKIQEKRRRLWENYHQAFARLEEEGAVRRPVVPDCAQHNAHMYYLKLKDLKTRTEFISYMREHGVMAVFHYVPLHSSNAGRKFGRFHGEDIYTTKESERLVRLPMFYNLGEDEAEYIIDTVLKFPNW